MSINQPFKLYLDNIVSLVLEVKLGKLVLLNLGVVVTLNKDAQLVVTRAIVLFIYLSVHLPINLTVQSFYSLNLVYLAGFWSRSQQAPAFLSEPKPELAKGRSPSYWSRPKLRNI